MSREISCPCCRAKFNHPDEAGPVGFCISCDNPYFILNSGRVVTEEEFVRIENIKQANCACET